MKLQKEMFFLEKEVSDYINKKLIHHKLNQKFKDQYYTTQSSAIIKNNNKELLYTKVQVIVENSEKIIEPVRLSLLEKIKKKFKTKNNKKSTNNTVPNVPEIKLHASLSPEQFYDNIYDFLKNKLGNVNFNIKRIRFLNGNVEELTLENVSKENFNLKLLMSITYKSKQIQK